MKLLGIEFNRYACFERCFVPLDTGIRLLVGRNNSGKTALLRGLETLRGLPFPGRGAFDTGVSRYSRAQDPYPHHFISIYFEYEPGDKAFLPEGVGAWPSFIAANRLQWKFSFTVIPSSGAMLFNGIDILIGQEKTVVLESRKNDVIRYHYNLDGSTHRVDTVAGKSGEVLSDGNILHTYDLSGVFSAFPKLMQTRMVSAHRVVRPLHQLQALDTLTDNADSLAPFLD